MECFQQRRFPLLETDEKSALFDRLPTDNAPKRVVKALRPNRQGRNRRNSPEDRCSPNQQRNQPCGVIAGFQSIYRFDQFFNAFFG